MKMMYLNVFGGATRAASGASPRADRPRERRKRLRAVAPGWMSPMIPGSRTLQTEINRMAIGHEALPSDVIRRIID